MLDDLQISREGAVSTTDDGSNVGIVTDQMLGAILQINSEPGSSVQLRCIVSRSRPNEDGMATNLSVCLCGIVYGPRRLFDSIGEFLESCNVFLQDPQGCDRNVPYRNPHRLSGLDRYAPMTLDSEAVVQGKQRNDCESSPNGLDECGCHQNLPLADNPFALQTTLFKHQRQALYFMMQRELGWNFTGSGGDIWKLSSVSNFPMYINTISNDVQMERPPTFCGGILADQMGLGKTLSILSLIASDLEHRPGYSTLEISLMEAPHDRIRRTLVVVPPTLIETWEDQLKCHCQQGSLQWRRHHRQHRLTNIAQLAHFNIILTTYQTIASDWKNHRASSILFSTRWHRIILDEAHQISDSHTRTAEAVCALEANCRWAVTGTPIQNHINDFLALLQFLRAYPYDNPVVFKQDIVNLWKDDSDAAIVRLRQMITCIALRRSSGTIELPEKNDHVQVLQFSPREREVYDRFEAQVLGVLSQFQDHSHDEQSRLYTHALRGLQALRSICNFGTLSNMKQPNSAHLATPPWGTAEAQSAFNRLLTAGDTSCTRCKGDVTDVDPSPESLDMDLLNFIDREPVISKCSQLLCHRCFRELQDQDGSAVSWCGHNAPCTAFPVSAHRTLAELTTTADDSAGGFEDYPTKVKALVEDLQLFPASKSLVFSAWRTTLDLIAQALITVGIRFVRYDGKVVEKDRSHAISQFSKDSTIKVILFTISCGAIGLDLTAADRVYLMEPQWNPTIEDQALARVYRIGQKRPTTTVRFIIKDSYEQRVLEVQNRKIGFTDLLLSLKNKMSPSGKGAGRFEYLRSLLY